MEFKLHPAVLCWCFFWCSCFFLFFFWGGGGRQTFIPHTSSDYFSAEDRLMKNRLHEMLQPTAQQAAPLRKLRGAIPLAYF